jgi:hypothetical protein
MKRTPLPAVLTDEALNRFITDVLLDAREKDAAGPALMTNTLIERTVEQLRKFFPEAYEGGNSGGNVHGGDSGGNVTAWPDRVGA